MPRPAVLLPALTIAAALVASTAVAGVAVAAAPHGRPAIAFHTTGNHVVAPASTNPGYAHLRNTGQGDVFVAGAKRGSGSAKQLARDLRAHTPNRFLKSYRLVGVVPARSSVYSRLTRGTYYLIDIDVRHLKAKRIEAMTVTGPRVDARTPEGRGVRITSHRKLRMPATIGHSGYLHVQNRSSALASFLFVAVDNAASRKMLAALVAHPSFLKLFMVADFRQNPFQFSPVPEAGPHSVSWVHYHGAPGRYIASVLTLSRSGSARLHHGQVRVLTLT